MRLSRELKKSSEQVALSQATRERTAGPQTPPPRQNTMASLDATAADATEKTPIVVTGVAGFIGSHTAERLLERGETVIGIDEVKDYFVGFIGADSPYVSVVPRFPATISPIDVQQLGNGFAAYSGYWNIDFETTEGALIEGFAKFTFVFERQSGGDLEIVLSIDARPSSIGIFAGDIMA